MRRRRWFIVCLVVVAAAIGTFVWHEAQPRYAGRSLRSWLRQCTRALDEVQARSEAEAAVRAIGAPNAVPVLLRFAAAKEDDDGKNPVRDWLLEKAERLHLYSPPSSYENNDPQVLAVAGFEALGTNAALGIPDLLKLSKDPEHEFVALRCLGGIGLPARAAVCNMLTNGTQNNRLDVIGYLPNVFDDVEPLVGVLRPYVTNRDCDVRSAAVQALGYQTNAPELVVPILSEVVSNGSAQEATHAATLLGGFGTNALSAYGVLSNAVEHSKTYSAITFPALRSMVQIAPERTLPILLRRMKSADDSTRTMALRFLIQYSNPSEEILAAVRSAAEGPDGQNAMQAKKYLTERYSSTHDAQPSDSDESGYEGRKLGWWLKQRHGGFVFTGEAQKALRSMGSNAVPSLLKRLVYTFPPYGMPAYDINIEAVAAFAVLGEGGKSALPVLEPMLDSTNSNTALHALLAMSQMGERVNDCLIRGLTNVHEDVRVQAVNMVEQQSTRFTATQKKECCAVLPKLLNDKSESVRMGATNAVLAVAPDMAAKLNVKTLTRDK